MSYMTTQDDLHEGKNVINARAAYAIMEDDPHTIQTADSMATAMRCTEEDAADALEWLAEIVFVSRGYAPDGTRLYKIIAD